MPILYLSVIVPAYNEEGRVGKMVSMMAAYLEHEGHNFEIIVVDDGSTDKTAEEVQQARNPRVALLKNGRNRGKGYSVRHGMLAASGEWFLMSDADLAFPVEELGNFMRHTDHDLIIGSRGLKASVAHVRQPLYREWGRKILNCFIQLFILPGICDTQCGFKLFRQNAARHIFSRQTIERFGFDVEILYLARKHGYTICEIPVRWSHVQSSKVRPFKDGMRIISDLVKIRLNDINGKYE